MRILITGISGFIGQALCVQVIKCGLVVRGALRKPIKDKSDIELVVVGEIDGATDWLRALEDVDVVIHLAARVHVLQENSKNPVEEFYKTNVAGTAHLARSAAASGVTRLVYVSSIGVNGMQTSLDEVFTEEDIPSPHNAYARSKWESERALLQVAQETGLEVVIVRAPLVYGAGAPGNFALMLKALAKNVPLPLASVSNKRSLIYIENIVDALLKCARQPAAAGQTYLVSDGEDISTPDLLWQLGAAMGHPARLFPCPPALLKLAGRLIGKSDQIDRLLGSLQVDSSKIRRELGWQPPFSLQEGLRLTVVS